MPDFATLKIANPADLVRALKDEVSTISTDWFETNKAKLGGYFETLSGAAMQTADALKQGRITPHQAEFAMHQQKAALEQLVDLAELEALALAQKLFDGVFGLVGWAIFKRTGINLFPELVKP